MDKIRSIQVLRGFAAFLVVLNHIWGISVRSTSEASLGRLLQVEDIGGFGVDIFFCISGFIMVWTLKRGVDHAELSRRFLVARMKRIYPIYAVWLALFLSAVFAVNTAGFGFQSEVFRGATPGELIRNFLLLPALPGNPNGMFLPQAWTLVYEMYFYVVFAACLLAGRKYISYTLTAGIGGLLLLSHLFGHPDRDNWTNIAYMIGDPLVLNFLFGAFLALLYKRRPLVVTHKPAALCAMAVLVVVALYALEGPRLLVLGLPALAILALTAGYEVERNPVNDALVYVGEASYSIYIVHIFVYFLTGKIAKVAPLPVDVTGILMSLVAVGFGCLSYSLLERPLSNLLAGRSRLATKPL
jgi:peptidoglycan/LPS O-acetylase OafA/YrhL